MVAGCPRAAVVVRPRGLPPMRLRAAKPLHGLARPALHGAERLTKVASDLGLREATVVGELDRFALPRG